MPIPNQCLSSHNLLRISCPAMLQCLEACSEDFQRDVSDYLTPGLGGGQVGVEGRFIRGVGLDLLPAVAFFRLYTVRTPF